MWSRHARNEAGMPGMPDLLAWACRVCRQAVACDSRREDGMPRIVSAGAAVCPRSSCVLPAGHPHMPGETRGPHLARRHPRNFRPPLHAGPTNMPPTGFPAFRNSCSWFTSERSGFIDVNQIWRKWRISIASLNIVEVWMRGGAGPPVLLQVCQQPLQVRVSGDDVY